GQIKVLFLLQAAGCGGKPKALWKHNPLRGLSGKEDASCRHSGPPRSVRRRIPQRDAFRQCSAWAEIFDRRDIETYGRARDDPHREDLIEWARDCKRLPPAA